MCRQARLLDSSAFGVSLQASGVGISSNGQTAVATSILSGNMAMVAFQFISLTARSGTRYTGMLPLPERNWGGTPLCQAMAIQSPCLRAAVK